MTGYKSKKLLAQTRKGGSMIEDIKVEQTYGWAVSPEGEKIWSMVSYRILFKRDGKWQEVPVHHVNPFPPEKSNEEREGTA